MALTKATLIDLNSNELALDLDGDTTLHSSTDDQIDIKIAGADDFTFTANAFNALAGSHITLVDNSQLKVGADTDLQIYHDGTNSYIANKTGALKIATETSGIAITIGHTTSEVTIADNVTVTGNINVGGTLTFVDGSIAIADLDIDGGTDISADLTTSDLIIIDDGAGGTNRKAALSRINTLVQTAGGFPLTALDIDGGTDIGAAIVDADLFIVDDGAGGTNRKTAASRLLTYAMAGTLSEAAQTNITSLGTLTTLTVDDITINGSTISDAGDFTLDVEGDIILDANGGDVFVKDAGTTFGSLTNTSGNLIIKSGTTTAATFSGANVTFAGTVGSGAITSTGIVTGTGFTAGNAVLAEAELELLDGITAGTGAASKAVVLDGSKNIAGLGTITAAGLDISGAVDVDGTTNLDQVDIDGTVNMALTALVTGVLTTTATTVFNGGFTSNDGSTITTADNTDTLSLISTDADANVGPNLNLYRNSSSPADNDTLGQLAFVGRNDNSQDFNAFQMTAYSSDVSDGTEDGTMQMFTMQNGSLHLAMQITPTETVFNDSSKDQDFRVESNGNANMLFVDGGSDKIVVGGTNVTGATQFAVTYPQAKTDTTVRYVQNWQSNEASGQSQLRLQTIGHASNQPNRKWQLQTSENGVSNAGQLELQVDGGSVQIGSTGGGLLFVGPDDVVVNEGSTDTNFRVESNGNVNMIFVDAGSDHVNIGTATDLGGVLNVEGSFITRAGTIPQATLSSSSNAVAWDALAKPNAQHTTSENTTIGAPSNGVSGQYISILIIFGGAHTIGWNTVFEFADSTEPTETSVNNKADLHIFRYNGTMWHEVGRNQNMAIS